MMKAISGLPDEGGHQRLRGSEDILIRSGEDELVTRDAIMQSRNHAFTHSRKHAFTHSRNRAVLIGSRELMLLLALHVKVEGGH